MRRIYASASVDLGALDQERDPHVGAVLVEVLAADPVETMSTARIFLSELDACESACLAASSVEGLGAADQFDDLDYRPRVLLLSGMVTASIPEAALAQAPGLATRVAGYALAQRRLLPAARGLRCGNGCRLGQELLQRRCDRGRLGPPSPLRGRPRSWASAGRRCPLPVTSWTLDTPAVIPVISGKAVLGCGQPV